jgi:hypothetical protein
MEEYTTHLKFPYKTLVTSPNLVHIHNNRWSSKTTQLVVLDCIEILNSLFCEEIVFGWKMHATLVPIFF